MSVLFVLVSIFVPWAFLLDGEVSRCGDKKIFDRRASR